MNSRNISKNEQTNDFDKLKSDYFLRKLFDFLKEIKSLNIIRYNKNLQKRLNINIDNYKECSKIEIELKLVDFEYDKLSNDKFINIPKKDKKYYHIYFDQKKKIKKIIWKKMKKLK